MKLKSLSIMVLCAGLAACGGVDPNSPLGKRQALFKAMLKTSEDLGGMLRGRIPFDETRFNEGAVKVGTICRASRGSISRRSRKRTIPRRGTRSGSARSASSNWPAISKPRRRR